MVAQMEAAGIERAILTCDVNVPRAVADMDGVVVDSVRSTLEPDRISSS